MSINCNRNVLIKLFTIVVISIGCPCVVWAGTYNINVTFRYINPATDYSTNSLDNVETNNTMAGGMPVIIYERYTSEPVNSSGHKIGDGVLADDGKLTCNIVTKYDDSLIYFIVEMKNDYCEVYDGKSTPGAADDSLIVLRSCEYTLTEVQSGSDVEPLKYAGNDVEAANMITRTTDVLRWLRSNGMNVESIFPVRIQYRDKENESNASASYIVHIQQVKQAQTRELLAHELGHVIQNCYFGWHASILGYVTPHNYRTNSNHSQAVVEGWAEFLGAYAWGQNHLFNCQAGGSYETDTYWKGETGLGIYSSPTKIEGAVLSVLWDIADGGAAYSWDNDGIDFGAHGGLIRYIWPLMCSTKGYGLTTRTMYNKWYQMGLNSNLNQRFRNICESNGISYSRGTIDSFRTDIYVDCVKPFPASPLIRSDVPLIGAFGSNLIGGNINPSGFSKMNIWNSPEGLAQIVNADFQISNRRVGVGWGARPYRTHVYPTIAECIEWEDDLHNSINPYETCTKWQNLGEAFESSTPDVFTCNLSQQTYDHKTNSYFDDPDYWKKKGMRSGYYLMRMATQDNHGTWDSFYPLLGLRADGNPADGNYTINPDESFYTTEWLCDIGALRLVNMDLERPRLTWIIRNSPFYKYLPEFSYEENRPFYTLETVDTRKYLTRFPEKYPSPATIMVRLEEPYRYSLPLRGIAHFGYGDDVIIDINGSHPLEKWMVYNIEIPTEGYYGMEVYGPDPLRDAAGNEVYISGYWLSSSSPFNRLLGDCAEFDPTFVQNAEERRMPTRESYWNNYVCRYHYNQTSYTSLDWWNAVQGDFESQFRCANVAQLIIPNMTGSSDFLMGLLCNEATTPAINMPYLFQTRDGLRDAVSTAADRVITDTDLCDGDIESISYVCDTYNGNLLDSKYTVAELTVRIEEEFTNQCAAALARLTADYGREAELVWLQNNGASAAEIARVKELAAREVHSRYAAEEARLGAARRARIFELHDQTNIRLQRRAWETQQALQANIRGIASRITGDTIVAPEPATEMDAPVIAFASGFAGGTQGILVDISGTISDSNTMEYAAYFGIGANPTVWHLIGDTHIAPAPITAVVDGNAPKLARWFTAEMPRREYTIKLVAVDRFGNRSEDQTTITTGSVFGEAGGIVTNDVVRLTGHTGEAMTEYGRGIVLAEPIGLQLNDTAIFTYHYTDTQAEGCAENDLTICWLDPVTNRWLALPTRINAADNIATAQVTTLGYLALTVPTRDYISPNNSPNVNDEWQLPAATGIIIDVSGETVCTVVMSYWNGQNDSGVYVADGEYTLHESETNPATRMVIVDNTAPSVTGLQLAVDAAGQLKVTGTVNDANLESFKVVLEGNYAGEERTLATRYANCEGVLAIGSVAGVAGQRVVVYARDLAGNEASGSAELAAAATVKELWCGQGWIAPEVESLDVPHSAEFSWELTGGVEDASLRIENETGAVATVRNGMTAGVGTATWAGTDNDSTALPAGRYVYRFAGAAGKDISYLRYFTAAPGELANYVKTVGAAGDYRITANQIAHVRADGTADSYITADGHFVALRDIATDVEGNIWALDSGRCTIEKLSPAGVTLLSCGGYGTNPGEYLDPVALASSEGVVYVLEGANGRIDRRDSWGRLTNWDYAVAGAQALGVNGTALYAQANDSTIIEYALGGGIIEVKDLIANISIPTPDAMVRANVPIFGLACGKNFRDYRVEYGQGWAPDTWVTMLWLESPQNDDIEPSELISGDRTIEGNLATWATGLTEYDYSQYDPRCVDQGIDGPYTIRLTVRNQSGKEAQDSVKVTVGRVMGNTYSGTVISEDGLVALIVPEQALNTDFLVMSIAGTDLAPATPTDQTLLGKVYEFRPAGATFARACTMEWTVPVTLLDVNGDGVADYDTSSGGIYHYNPESKVWTGIGGSWQTSENGTVHVDADIMNIASGRGYYALLTDTLAPTAPALLQPASPTEASAVVVRGTAEANSEVEISGNDAVAATADVASDGTFWAQVALVDGENVFTAVAIDGLGQRSAVSNAVTVVRQRKEPTAAAALVCYNSSFNDLSDTAVAASTIIGIELRGNDADANTRNRAGVTVSYGGQTATVELIEMGLNSGTYRGQWRVPYSTSMADGAEIVFTAVADADCRATLAYRDTLAPCIMVLSIDGQAAIRESFDDSNVGGWNAGSDGCVENVARDAAGQDRVLRATATYAGGNFRLDWLGAPFNVDEQQLLSFDYRMSPETKLNLLVKAGGRWYDIRLTDDPKSKYYDVNMELLTELDGQADGEWHRVTVDLGAELERVTQARTVEALCFADWDVQGFMKLVPGGANPVGAWLELDNVSISGAIRTPVTARAEVADASGVENIGWQLADIGVSEPDTTWAGTAYELPATEKVGLSTLIATAKDAHGNSASVAMPVFIDNAEPQIGEPREAQFSAHGTLRLPVFELGSGVGMSSVVLEVGGTQLTASDTRLAYRDGELQVSGSGFTFANGADVAVRLLQLYDRAGNSATDLPKEWTLPWREERVLITEVDAEGDDFGNDGGSWIELYCAAGPVDISGSSITDYEHNTNAGMSLANAPVTINTGDYVVVHIGSGNDETDDGNGGWNDWNDNGVRDLYYANGMSIRQIEDGVSLLYNGVMDAVVWKQNPSVIVNEYEWDDFFSMVVAGAWEYTGGSFASMAADMAGGNRIARKSPALDTNRREDWVAVDNGTPGVENVIVNDQIPPGTPAGVSATGGERNISVRWNVVSDTDVAGYLVYRNDIAGPAVTVDGLTWTDEGVTVGTPYRYSVAAIDKSDNIGRASGSVSAMAYATATAPVLQSPVPAVVGVSELMLQGYTEQAGSIVVNSSTGAVATASVTSGDNELILGADELVNVFGCEYHMEEVQQTDGVGIVSYYTLATPPEMRMSTPFVNRMGGWESADGWNNWKTDGILRNGAGHLLVYRYLSLSDYTVRTRVRPVSGNTAFRFSANSSSGYSITFDAQNGTSKLLRTVYGEATELGEWAGPEAGTWTELAIAKKGTQLLVLQDGAMVLNVTDNQALPNGTNWLFVDNQGGNTEYDYVEVFRGDLVGVIATPYLSRANTGAITGVRVNGDAGAGSVLCEVEDSGVAAQAMSTEAVSVNSDYYRVLATLWRTADEGVAPVVRALHCDLAAGFAETVPLVVGENLFTATQTVGGAALTGNTVAVTRINAPALQIAEIGLENGTLNGGYVEVLNAGDEPVMLTDLRLGVGTADNQSLGIYGDVGMLAGPLAPGARAICHAARPDVYTENETTGDINENGVLDVSYEDYLDLNGQRTIILVWQGAIVDAVPLTDAAVGAAEQEPDLMRTLTTQGYWQGNRVLSSNQRIGRSALSRREGTAGNRADDWMLARPTPGGENSDYAVPAPGQVLINELSLAADSVWVEILGVSGECDAGALWLTDLDGDDFGPLTEAPQRLQAGGRLVAPLPTGRLDAVDELAALSGWNMVDAVMWQTTGEYVSDDEQNDQADGRASGQWTDEAAAKGSRAVILGRIPDGQDSNKASDWRVALPTPGAANARDEQGPQVTMSINPARFEPMGTLGETYCTITVTVNDPTDAQTMVCVEWVTWGTVVQKVLFPETLCDNGEITTTWDGYRYSSSPYYGDWTIRATATDVAGNIGTANAPVTVLKENVPPVVWLEYVGAHQDSFVVANSIVLKATDNNRLQQPYINYQLDNGWWRGAWATEVQVQLPSTDGAHTLKYYAADWAGNSTATVTMPFVLDSSAPVVSWTLDDAKRLTLTATDGAGIGLESLELGHMGGALLPYTGPVGFYGAGTYLERYQASDRLGNRREGTFAITVPASPVAPRLDELPTLTGISQLTVNGTAVSRCQVRLEQNGQLLPAIQASERVQDFPIAAFTERDSSVVEDDDFLTLAGGRTAWADDFEDGDMAGWEVTGDWQVVDGQATVATGGNIARTDWLDAPVYVLAGECKPGTGFSRIDFNVSEQGYYALYLYHNGTDNSMLLTKTVNGARTNLMSYLPIEYADGTCLPFTLEVVRGNSITATVGGVTKAVTDGSLDSGYVRLGTETSRQCSFDNLSVSVDAPTRGLARTAPANLTGLGEVAGIITHLEPGAGAVSLAYSEDQWAMQRPLYEMADRTPADGTVFEMELLAPKPTGARPRCDGVTLVGWGDYSTTVTLVEGENRFVAYAEDAMGNRSAASETRVVIYDTKAPVVTVKAPPTSFIVRDTMAVEMTITDSSPLTWLLWVTGVAGDTRWSASGTGMSPLALSLPAYVTGASGKVTLRWSVTDAVGNVKTGSRAGTLLSTDPGAASVLITELDMTPDEGPRWAELMAVRGPVNIAGWKLSDLDGTDTMLALKPVTLQTGDVVAVYWGDGDDEIDATGGGWTDLDGNGARELYVSDPAPNTTDDQLVLLNGDSVVDAVIISDYDGSLPADEATDMGWLYDRWGWNEDGRVGGQQVAARLMPDGWGSIGRIPGAPDTGRKADWAGMRPTPGRENVYIAPPAVGSVLINEVKIDDFFEREQDWVELYCVNGPVDVGNLVLGDLDTIEGERLLTSEAPFTLNTGEYCVIHLLPVTGVNEADNASSDSWTDVNGNGIRDIYAPMTQLQANDDQLALYALDRTVIDALCWSDRDGSLDPDEGADNEQLVDGGAWQGDGSQADAAHLQSNIYPLGRVPNALDSDRANDWRPCFPTPGAANVAVGDDHVPPQTWLESWGPMFGNGTDTYIASWSQFYMRSFDDLSGVAEKFVIIDGAPEQLYSDPIVLPDEGWHTINYYGVDNAGNAEPEHTLRVYVDATAPQVALSLDAQNQLVIAATDDAAGVGDIQFSHVGQSMEEYTGPAAFYGPGDYVVTYRVTDRVENSITDSVVLTVPDYTPPPTMAELPAVTNVTMLSIGGEAESGRLVRVLNDGNMATVVRAATHEVTVSAAEFVTRDAGIAEESGMLTVTPYSELWSDNFADGDMAGWYVVGGTARVENGELVFEGNGFAGVEQRTICNAPEFSMTGVIRDETDHWETDMAYYVTDWNLYRLVEYNPNRVQFDRHLMEGDKWQAIGSTTTMPEYAVGRPLPYRIDKYADGTMRGFIGGAEVHGSDQLYSSGHLRFWGWDPDQNKHIKIVLDDVRVFTGAPRSASAQGNAVDLSGLGRIVAVRADVLANAGIVDIWTGTDETNRTQLYTLAGSNITSLMPVLELQHPQPEAIRPTLGLITLRGMGEYSAGVSLHEGPNVLTVVALNEAGEQGTPSEEHVVILDTQKPVITGISVTPASFSPASESAVLGFTLVDNLSDRPGSLRVTVTDEAGEVVRELLNASPAAYGTRSVAWDGLNEVGSEVAAGSYLFRIDAADAAGNQATASAAVRVQSDATPPQITITVPVVGAQLSYTQTLAPQWSVSDTESGVASSSATLDGQAVVSGDAINLLTLGVGSHILAISATDNAGNSATASVTFSVIDDVPPVITLQQPATPTNQDVTLVYTETDVITPANQLVITGNNSPYSAEGSHSVALTATDVAGNSGTSNTVTFVIDKTAPVTELQVGTPQYGVYVTPATPLTLTATDNLTSVAVTRYRIDGGDWQTYSGAFTLAGEGSHVVGYASTDIVGNIETEKSIALIVDATAPECVLTLDLTDSTGNIAVPESLVTLTASDAGAGVAGIEYKLNDGGWQAYAAPFEVWQLGITSGQLVIAYRATDKLGNVGAGQSRTVTVKPALELSAGLLNTPRVLAWWNEPADGQHPSKDAGLAALSAVLDSAALNYRIVENAADFKVALGDYNVYLILGDQVTLDDAGDSLVAAQVALGKSLVSFGYEDIGTPESTDRGWQNIFGVKVAGVLNGTSELTVNKGDFAADTLVLAIEGQTERITEVLSGDVLGTVLLTESGERNGGNGNGNGGNGGSNQEAYPAVVANGWGMGKVLYAVPEYSRNLAGLADVLRNAVAWVAPAQEVVLPGGSVALRIAVNNAVLPLTLMVNVVLEKPAGGDVIAIYDDGRDDGNEVEWYEELAATETGEYRCVLRLPSELAGCVVHVDAAYLHHGGYLNKVSVNVAIQ